MLEMASTCIGKRAAIRMGRPSLLSTVVRVLAVGLGCASSSTHTCITSFWWISGGWTESTTCPTTDVSANTTGHLVADMECVRQHLGIDRWMVFGGSWGATLALVYAQRHPAVVTALILWGVALT